MFLLVLPWTTAVVNGQLDTVVCFGLGCLGVTRGSVVNNNFIFI